MYKQFYGFKEYPFKLTPDPDFLYPSPIHKKALLYLTYGLEAKKGFIQLTGEVGSGKTTIIRSLIKSFHKEVKTAYIVNPKLTFNELFHMILSQFSIITPDSTRSKNHLLDKFCQYLNDQAKKECHVVIILDEAQNIEPSVLEEIRLLSNLETEKEKLLQIIFVGQPELRNVFSRPELRQLKQRICTAVHIEPLSKAEMERYINHRVGIAGANGSVIFEKRACNEIYLYSNGIPRLINIACDAVLLAGYVKGKKVFDGTMAKEVISELTADGIGGETAAVPSAESRTSIMPKARRSRWKVALALSILFAAIVTGIILMFWQPLISQKLDYITSVIKRTHSVILEPKPDTNLLEKKNGT
ncbi:MAG: ExeA family protein [Candidatus Brocadiales bacterium]